MTSLYKYIFIILLVLMFSGLRSQSLRDSSVNFPMFSGSYSLQIPGGNLADRFGINSSAGGGFMYKTSSNWVFGADGYFIFGNKLKEEASSIFNEILTSDGNIIDENGEFATVLLSERGFYIGGKAGRVIPVFGSNPNSGIMFIIGAGLLQHKIRIENDGNRAPQIIGDYKKGYDKLTNGFASNIFLGYVYFGNNRLLNFFGGIDYTIGWTQCRRDFNFDERITDETRRTDMLYSIRVGWIIPIYRHLQQKFYY